MEFDFLIHRFDRLEGKIDRVQKDLADHKIEIIKEISTLSVKSKIVWAALCGTVVACVSLFGQYLLQLH